MFKKCKKSKKAKGAKINHSKKSKKTSSKRKAKAAAGEMPQKAMMGDEQSIDKYYTKERRKIDKDLLQLEITKTKAYIELTEKEYIQIRQKRHHLDEIHHDIIKRIGELTKKIAAIRLKKHEKEDTAKKLKDLGRKIKNLEMQEKITRSERSSLVAKERNVLGRIHKLLSEPATEAADTVRKYKQKFKNIENTRTYILAESQQLLSKESGMLTANLDIISRMSFKTAKQIQKINQQLKLLSRRKAALLWKKELLEFSEEKAQKELNDLRKRYRILEKKLMKLLHKK